MAKAQPGCASVDDMKQQFRETLESKVTPTKAEHVSINYEFRLSVTFDVPVSESENDGLENGEGIDPSLGGMGASVGEPVQDAQGRQGTRRIKASEAVMNQPQDDPTVQRDVAKHIIGALSEVDGSTWVVRSMSRAASGWTFIYNCKDSMQSWLRQHAKGKTRAVVGESSGKDGQDAVNLSRPAFDCRGMILVSFARREKMITVKYEHTPLHKTVSQLAEVFIIQEASPKKVPERAQRAPRDPNATPKRKRAKKDSNAADEGDGEEGAEDEPKPKRKRKSRAKSNGGDGANGAAGTVEAIPAPAAPTGNFPIKLPPGEAARRKEVATKLLSSAGLDPATLSPEQFEIFANQSPELQRDSLAMFVQYGAERLRIVHPSNANANVNGSSQGTPARDSQAAGVSAPAQSAESGVTTKTRKKSDADGAAGDSAVGTPSGTGKKTARVRITRGKCEGCKARKVAVRLRIRNCQR